jgi:hypothetical protein
MKRKLSPIVVLPCLLFVLLTSGCSWTGHFYPVQGPLAAQTPVPVCKASMTPPFAPGHLSGHLSVHFGHGDVCTGKWKEGNAEPISTSTPGSMAAVWDALYGPSFYNANVLGASGFASATATCKSGNILTVEMYNRNVDTHEPVDILGVARDSRGNLYKVALAANLF